MADSIQATFGLDIGPLQRGFAAAEKVAASSASRVQRTLEGVSRNAGRSFGTVPINWSNVAPRASMADLERQYSPWRRNFASAYRPAPPGKYPAPEEDVGRTKDPWAIRGLGGRISLVVGLERALHFWEQMNKEAGELAQKVNQITRLTGSTRTSSDIAANLKENIAVQEELRKRRNIESQVGEGAAWRLFGSAVRKGRQFLTGDSDANESEQIARLRKAASKDIGDSAAKQEQLNKARRQALHGDEEQAALLEEEVKNREKLAELAEIAVRSGSDDNSAIAAENARYELEKTAIRERFRLKSEDLQSEMRIVAIKDEGLTADQKSIALLQEKLRHLRAEQAGAGTVQAKAAFGPEIAGTENELYRAKFAEFRKPNSQKLEEQLAASREQQDYDYFRRHPPGAKLAMLTSDEDWRKMFPRRIGLRGDSALGSQEIFDLYGGGPSFVNRASRAVGDAVQGGQGVETQGAGRSIELINNVSALIKTIQLLASKIGIL